MPVGGTDVWQSMGATLARRAGEAEELAVLLCSLLLGFGLEAYVAVGKDEAGPRVWVMSAAEQGSFTFWDPASGARYHHAPCSPAASPYLSIGCAFNHESFYANLQEDDALSSSSLALGEPLLWRAIDPALLRRLTPLPAPRLTAPASQDGRVGREVALEAQLRRRLEAHRASLGLATSWDTALESTLGPALHSYELEAQCGATLGAPEFKLAVKRCTPTGHTFRGYPAHFTHARPAAMARHLATAAGAAGVLQCKSPRARLALRLRTFAYPDGVTSAWLLLACSAALE
mmetsp:Transcript_8309/g.26813  ORF Transcript_8309/g.26813 Transcript_8309/m.26813 type:complete len:289 (+) Transcript_8309:1-867(+)